MPDALIIDTCRTPRGIGKQGKGALADCHPQHLAATVLRALAESYAVLPAGTVLAEFQPNQATSQQNGRILATFPRDNARDEAPVEEPTDAQVDAPVDAQDEAELEVHTFDSAYQREAAGERVNDTLSLRYPSPFLCRKLHTRLRVVARCRV